MKKSALLLAGLAIGAVHLASAATVTNIASTIANSPYPPNPICTAIDSCPENYSVAGQGGSATLSSVTNLQARIIELNSLNVYTNTNANAQTLLGSGSVVTVVDGWTNFANPILGVDSTGTMPSVFGQGITGLSLMRRRCQYPKGVLLAIPRLTTHVVEGVARW